MEICPKGTFISIWHFPVQIKVYKENTRTNRETSETYSEPRQTSKMKLSDYYSKQVNVGWKVIKVVLNSFGVWLDCCKSIKWLHQPSWWIKQINPFVPNAPFLYLPIFWCFRVYRKGALGRIGLIKYLLSITDPLFAEKIVLRNQAILLLY